MAELPDVSGVNAGDPEQYFGVVPRGKYTVQILSSDRKVTADGNGEFLVLEEEIIDGQYKGRKLWDRLNLWNENQTTVEIAQRTLAQICAATNMVGVRDSQQLHYKAMVALVAVRPARTDPATGKNYGEQNEIKGYLPIGRMNAPADVPAKGAVPAKAAQPSDSSASNAPWRRKAAG